MCSEPCPLRASHGTFILTCRFDTPDLRVPMADFSTSPDVNFTLFTGPYTPFAEGFKVVVVEATGEYAGIPLPLPQRC